MAPPDINFINRTGKTFRLARPTWRALYRRARQSQPLLRGRKNLSLVFITAAEARRLNRLYRRKNRPTNVLTFAAGEADELGDILICPALAKIEARAQGQPLASWLVYLWAHGLLHLAGFDHNTPRAARRMEAAIAKILA